MDPDNRWLWRMNRRRLDFEALRDTILAIGGDLDLTMGGKSGQAGRGTVFAAAHGLWICGPPQRAEHVPGV